MREIGVVIVTHNSAAEIGPCLDALGGLDVDVVVIDNASSDATREEAVRRGAHVVANPSNAGFAAAVNQGFHELTNRFVLLLNPDARVVGGLAALRDACAHPDVGLAGGRLLDAAGTLQVGFMARRLPGAISLMLEVLLLNRLFPMNPVNRRYRCLDLDYSLAQPVEQPAGAFLMVRRDVWETLGGFDESFHPVWFEDVDFCRRARDRGFRAYYVPDAVARHAGGHSVSGIAVHDKAFYWYRSLLSYAEKHFRPWARRAIGAAVVIGSVPRMILAVVAHGSLAPSCGYGRAIRMGLRMSLYGCTHGRN